MYFKKFVINLPERKDRRRDMEQQLKGIGWSAEFFPAIRPDRTNGFPSIGARGCFESHLALLKIGARCEKPVVIMEDDLSFSPSISKWDETVNQLSDWDVFYPAHYLEQKMGGVTPLQTHEGVRCAHFMAFHPRSIDLIVADLEEILSRPAGHPFGGPMHVDGAYATIRRNRADLKTYAFTPSMGFQRSSKSDIADIPVYDRFAALSKPVNMLRNIKNRLAQTRM